ncbi:MAG: bifunctional phosphopantothenoylcysteine decarboxylase/phosphopantothenate--cysteine ligase CoaBC [Chitinispirillaceae bacterium]|jgi:phosphopantothenoylcysteine decarboxylase/phosphopantothenate--cysteine ligase|nr:bifunctional phosphopantothenoylcysteine decarboxylase/phosphopantothenate--cysteine ligase CoaBC [Chitinispirillaceae bacterium]
MRILIGLSGGIAAYKIPLLIRMLTKHGADVKCACTPAALSFVGEETLATLTGHPLYRDDKTVHDLDHIRLSEWADTYCICPATANTIAKIAAGIADNLVTTLALSIPPAKIVIAPAMNTVMWDNPVTQENIARLKKRGITILPVGSGELACGTTGQGRMTEPKEISDYLLSTSGAPGALAGKNILISSGPTLEPIDPVRVITNRSSGRMGSALARHALMQGARVTVVTGPATAPLPEGARIVRVQTAVEMREAMLREISGADICIMAAAVGDFTPETISPTKIKRSGDRKIIIELKPNPDILAELGRRKKKTFLAGFALETNDGAASAQKKLRDKNCDLMILNGVNALDSEETQITIFDKNGTGESCGPMNKNTAAALILKRIAEHFGV